MKNAKRVLWVFLACGLIQVVGKADESTHRHEFDDVPPGSWPYWCARIIKDLSPDAQAQSKVSNLFARPWTRYEFAVMVARIEDRFPFLQTKDGVNEEAAWEGKDWPESKDMDVSVTKAHDIVYALHREFNHEISLLDGRISLARRENWGENTPPPPRFTTSLVYSVVPLSDTSYTTLRKIYSRLSNRPVPPWLARPMTRYEFGAAVISLVENRADEIKRLPYGGAYVRDELEALHQQFLLEIKSCGVQSIDFETLDIKDGPVEALPKEEDNQEHHPDWKDMVVPHTHWAYQALDKVTQFDFFKDAQPHGVLLKGHLTRKQFGVFALQLRALLEEYNSGKGPRLIPKDAQLAHDAIYVLSREFRDEISGIEAELGLAPSEPFEQRVRS